MSAQRISVAEREVCQPFCPDSVIVLCPPRAVSSMPPMLAIELVVDCRRTEPLCGSALDGSELGNGYCEGGEDGTGEAKLSPDSRGIGEDIS